MILFQSGLDELFRNELPVVRSKEIRLCVVATKARQADVAQTITSIALDAVYRYEHISDSRPLLQSPHHVSNPVDGWSRILDEKRPTTAIVTVRAGLQND